MVAVLAGTRISAGKLVKRAKKVGLTRFLRELDTLVGIKTDPRGRRTVDREIEPSITADTHSWADIGEAFHHEFLGNDGAGAFRRLKDLRFGGLRGGMWTATEEAGDGAMGPGQGQHIAPCGPRLALPARAASAHSLGAVW